MTDGSLYGATRRPANAAIKNELQFWVQRFKVSSGLSRDDKKSNPTKGGLGWRGDIPMSLFTVSRPVRDDHQNAGGCLPSHSAR